MGKNNVTVGRSTNSLSLCSINVFAIFMYIFNFCIKTSKWKCWKKIILRLAEKVEVLIKTKCDSAVETDLAN